MSDLVFTARDIPEDVASLLAEAAGLGDKAAWRIGRLTNALMDDLKAEGVQYSRQSLYKAVAAHAGCASETVRMRAHVQRRFPKWLSEKYPWLSFHQAKALVPVGKGEDDKYEALIQAWEEHSASTLISVTSVDGLRAWLHQEDGAPSPALVRYRRMITQVQKVISDGDTPAVVAQLLRALVKDVEYYARLEKLDDWIPEEL